MCGTYPRYAEQEKEILSPDRISELRSMKRKLLGVALEVQDSTMPTDLKNKLIERFSEAIAQIDQILYFAGKLDSDKIGG